MLPTDDAHRPKPACRLLRCQWLLFFQHNKDVQTESNRCCKHALLVQWKRWLTTALGGVTSLSEKKKSPSRRTHSARARSTEARRLATEKRRYTTTAHEFELLGSQSPGPIYNVYGMASHKFHSDAAFTIPERHAVPLTATKHATPGPAYAVRVSHRGTGDLGSSTVISVGPKFTRAPQRARRDLGMVRPPPALASLPHLPRVTVSGGSPLGGASSTAPVPTASLYFITADQSGDSPPLEGFWHGAASWGQRDQFSRTLGVCSCMEGAEAGCRDVTTLTSAAECAPRVLAPLGLTTGFMEAGRARAYG
jgi:hypothetical protein